MAMFSVLFGGNCLCLGILKSENFLFSLHLPFYMLYSTINFIYIIM
jgi:hypothetical protein